jgi:predicted acyl esterase
MPCRRIAGQDWCNQRIGMSGFSAGATTTFAVRHPSLRAFFAQAGASSQRCTRYARGWLD